MPGLIFLLPALAALLSPGCASPVSSVPALPVVAALPMATAPVSAPGRGAAAAARVMQPDFVLIDTRRAAFVLYRGLSESSDAGELAVVGARAAADPRLELPGWKLFTGAPGEQIGDRFLRNDYPEINIEQSLIELIRRYPGKSFGVTWNGGLAVTAAEFKYAEKTLAMHTARPGSAVREQNRQDDPVYPLTRIARMLRARQ